MVIHASHNLLDLFARQPSDGTNGLQWQIEECERNCLDSMVTDGEVGNELCLLAA